MTKFWKIISTAVLSAFFVPTLLLVPVWCVGSDWLRTLIWDMSYLVPGWAITYLIGAIGLLIFALACIAFAWIIKWIWTSSNA